MKQFVFVILSALILFACDSEADKKEATQFFLRGNQKFKEKEYFESIKWYSEAISKQSKFSDAYYNRGLVYQSLDKNDEALADFQKAFELDPRFSAALSKQTELLQNLQQFDLALESAAKLVKNFQDSSAFWSLQGDIYLQKTQYNDALASYEHALLLKPNAVETLINKGIVYQELGQLDLSETSFKAALATGKYKDLIYNNLGYLEIQRRQWKLAEQWIKMALAIDPKNELYLKNLDKIAKQSSAE